MANPFIREPRRVGPEISSYDPDTFLVVDSITFSAAIEETHEKSATITDHPIAYGALASDHVQSEPDRYTAELVVTNTPLDTTPESLLIDPDRVAQADETLCRTMDAGRPVQVLGGFRRYSQMLIETYSATRNKDTGQLLRASLSLRSFNIVQAEESDIPAAIAAPPQAPDAAPAVDGGTQTGTQTTPEAALAGEATQVDKSVAAGLFDSAGNFGGF